MTLNLELSVDPVSRVRPPYSWQNHRINDVFFSEYHIRRLPSSGPFTGCYLVCSKELNLDSKRVWTLLLALGTRPLNLWDILPEKSVFVYLETWVTPNNLIYNGDLGLCDLRVTPRWPGD